MKKRAPTANAIEKHTRNAKILGVGFYQHPYVIVDEFSNQIEKLSSAKKQKGLLLAELPLRPLEALKDS